MLCSTKRVRALAGELEAKRWNTEKIEALGIDHPRIVQRGGEVGVKAYNATGNIPTRDAPPTLGWGPPVLLLAAIGTAGYYLNPGDPAEELNAAVSTAVGAKSAIDALLSPEQENLVLEGAGVVLAALVGASAVGSAAKKVGEGLGNVVKTGLLGAVALGVAGKILEIW